MDGPTVRLAVPQKKNMSDSQWALVQALRARLEHEGLRNAYDGVDNDRLDQRHEQVRRSQGVIVLALPQWTAKRLYRDQDRSVITPMEFCHIAATMAVAAQKPLLVLRGKDVSLRGALKEGYVHPVVVVPKKAGPEWLKSGEFENAFGEWLAAVRQQRHVFLGYSSKAKPMADAVSRFITQELGLSVLDWHDPPPSGVIIQNIAKLERRTMFGLFLFTKDDKQVGKDGQESVPRDNVIYEAGYFAGAKGPEWVLIIREGAARVPTDLGGFTYVNVKNRSDLGSVESQIRAYFASRLPEVSIESQV